MDCPTEVEYLPSELNEIRKVSSNGSKVEGYARGDFVGPLERKRYMVE